MSYITDMTPQLSKAGQTLIEGERFNVRIPYINDALSVGIDTPTGAETARATVEVDWNPNETNVKLWLPTVLTRVLLPNRVLGPQLRHIGPFSGIVAYSSFRESYYRPAVNEDGQLHPITDTIFDNNDCFKAVALDGLFRALIGAILKRREQDKQESN